MLPVHDEPRSTGSVAHSQNEEPDDNFTLLWSVQRSSRRE